MSKDILNFLRGFGGKKKEPEPIKAGDTCRNKDTGVYSTCKKIVDGVYYGKNYTTSHWEVGIVDNFEKV